MSSPDLRSELRRAAEATAESILAAARAEAQRIVAEADRSTEHARRESLRVREDEYRAASRAALATARRDAMRALLEARTRLVTRVLHEARALLAEASRAEGYRARLPAHLAEALRFVPEHQVVVVRCPPELLSAVREAVGDRPHVRAEADAEMEGGFVLSSEDASMRIDQRLVTKLEEARVDLAMEILARWEHDGDGQLSR